MFTICILLKKKIRMSRLLRFMFIMASITFIAYTWIRCISSYQHPASSNLRILGKFQGHYIDCNPHSNIVFLKTHKCGSSTIQNILMRYGHVNDKIFVLPSTKNYLGYYEPFTRGLVPDPKTFNASYNILTHHTRFNFQEMQSLMPNDTIFISIVRDPVYLFESLFNYYLMEHIWNFNITDFNDDLWELPDNVSTIRLHNKFGVNQMMHDMGFDTNPFDKQKVLSYIDELDSIFSLVMVLDRMEESLILLKNLLCWSYDDVVVFNINAGYKAYKRNITDIGYQRIQELNKADALLYNHFAKKFAENVKTFGEDRMKKELKILKKKTEWFYKECGNTTIFEGKITRFINSNENNLTCQLLTTKELEFTEFIRNEQIIKHPGSVFEKGKP